MSSNNKAYPAAKAAAGFVGCVFFMTMFSVGYAQASGQTLHGKVVRIADGDTLTVLEQGNRQVRIRLAEIDAPESGQAFGTKSRQALASMCARKTAVVRVQDTDRYGRTIGRVYCDGVDTSAEQVRLGMAWVYDNYVRDKQLYALQDEARRERRGLWADPNPKRPWEWRRDTKSSPAKRTAHGHTHEYKGGNVRGNRVSRIYHLPHCPSYGSMRAQNIVPFKTEDEAKRAGFKKAGNCP